MDATFSLSVTTPENTVFSGEVVYLSVPGAGGYMGILHDHAPMISALRPGRFEVRKAEGGTPLFFTTRAPGFLELKANQATVLLDAQDSGVLSV
ncbi:MAG: F0F1 ATP synthase subunit epsilon [Elusimicrobia bacterium]|nr:F0F1 ATP synthase subunit epsilon [Elusimicrobiota bacterium]